MQEGSVKTKRFKSRALRGKQDSSFVLTYNRNVESDSLMLALGSAADPSIV